MGSWPRSGQKRHNRPVEALFTLLVALPKKNGMKAEHAHSPSIVSGPANANVAAPDRGRSTLSRANAER
jgi:hypothetical protein